MSDSWTPTPDGIVVYADTTPLEDVLPPLEESQPRSRQVLDGLDGLSPDRKRKMGHVLDDMEWAAHWDPSASPGGKRQRQAALRSFESRLEDVAAADAASDDILEQLAAL